MHYIKFHNSTLLLLFLPDALKPESSCKDSFILTCVTSSVNSRPLPRSELLLCFYVPAEGAAEQRLLRSALRRIFLLNHKTIGKQMKEMCTIILIATM